MRIIASVALIVIFAFSVLGLAQGVVPATVEEKIIDGKFVIVSSALIAASIFDVETAISCVRKGTCRESNPFLRPLFDSGRPAVYALEMGVNAAAIAVAYEMKKSPNRGIRRWWWVVPVSVSAAHLVGGTMNLRFRF